MADTINTAGCLLELPSGKFVFQRRTKDAPISAHMLSTFGGHLENDEKALHAVRREMAEETSLDVKHLSVRHVGTYIGKSNGVHISLYIAHILKPDFKVFEGEGEETYSLEELLAKDDLAPHTRLVINEYKGSI